MLKVQTFEDGLLARMLAQYQTDAEKANWSSPHDQHSTPALVGVGHTGIGEELLCLLLLFRALGGV